MYSQTITNTLLLSSMIFHGIGVSDLRVITYICCGIALDATTDNSLEVFMFSKFNKTAVVDKLMLICSHIEYQHDLRSTFLVHRRTTVTCITSLIAANIQQLMYLDYNSYSFQSYGVTFRNRRTFQMLQKVSAKVSLNGYVMHSSFFVFLIFVSEHFM